ncbi:esterase-like activity of phytase family protein [Streptomyces sp. SID13031]|uniref:esterase-like activity of phytase family protein n=1 Tax=Streptomyces sp. SID13031 TaxID=2706046 RepID=UPI0013C5AF09|nr:esterase-like activity of phytase family protein [Streptomyces sp. SID13031]NEA34288.1 esterase-like activity of phytase family protein [Streptomyces sp. SID13031]
MRNALTLTAVTLLSLAGAAIPAGSAGASGTTPRASDSAAAEPTPGAPKRLFSIDDSRVEESSGLAKSSRYDGIWWTVNDSGDTARVFGVDKTGKVRVQLKFKAPVKDVEAIAVDNDGTIYIADIGDNNKNRDMIEVYTIPEPARLEDEENVKFHRYDFEYPDGAHDAETLLIEPQTKRLYFVTKVKKKAGAIYAAPESATREGTNKLTKLAAAPVSAYGVTDGTFMPDGKTVVLRTYLDVTTLAWGDTPTVVAQATTPVAQGESVAVGPSGSDILVGSEGKGSVVYQMAAPAKPVAAKPPAAATPGATPKPSANASTEPKKNHSLRWIVVGAALLAMIITFVTFPAGRRERLDRMAENARLTGQPPPNPHGRRRSNA